LHSVGDLDTYFDMSRLKAPQRRRQLIAVATKQFAKHGYDAATTAAIAQAARITEPILYRHFGSKQELFIAITRDVSAQTLKHWRELIASTDNPAEQLRLIAKRFPAHLKELQDAYRVIHNALTTSRDRKVLAVLREHYKQIEAFFHGIISAGVKRGVFRSSNPKTASWLLINVGLGYAMTQNLAPFETFDVEGAIEFILRGLRP
jgi:AcrR family transcriptional regulator